MADLFKCKAKSETGYCKMWLRQCVGASSCKQGNCAYCENAALNPKEKTVCNKCDQFDWKKENYQE